MNRKCPYCSAEILTPNPPTVTLGGPPGAHWRSDKRVPGSNTPTSGTRACPPNAPQPEVRARLPPGALLRVAQPVLPGPGEDSTPERHAPLGAGERRGKDSRGVWGTSPTAGRPHGQALGVLGATPQPTGEPTPMPRFPPRDTPSG